MRKIIHFLDKHSKIVFRVLFFVITTAVLLYIFPREGNFPYEFSKGKPWLHNDLYSSFDFPIMKTDAEIKAEKDSILKDFKPYYTYRDEIAAEQVNKFNKAFRNQWEKYSKGLTRQTLSDQVKNFYLKADSASKMNLQRKMQELLLQVYEKGIIEVTDHLDQIKTKDFTIVIIRNNVAEEYNFSDVFTPKSAYEYIMHRIDADKNMSDQEETLFESGFYKELNINEFLLPNLLFNEEASRIIKDDLIKKISYTKGMFPADRKIIARGEIVNEEKYNLLMSLKYEYENRLGHSAQFGSIVAGQALIFSGLLLVLIIFLVSFRREVYSNNLKFSFILLLVIIFVGLPSLIINKDWNISLYIIPFAVLPMIVKTFYDARLSLFVYTITILMVGFIAPNSFEFVFLNFISGAIAVLGLSNLYRRGKLFNTAFFVITTYCVLYFGLYLLQGHDIKSILKDVSFLNNCLFFVINGVLLLITYPLIFIFEKVFGFLSDITLLELSDTNQPLLRRLNEKAPGTFQHSLQVANLAEDAAFKIGANPLLVRAGALYHDIGKMQNPMYFIENLSTEKSPHDDISSEASAGIIIEHVTKGVEIGHKYRLPEPIIDFIRTHHGTTTVQFFYRTLKKQNPDREIDMSKFTYPGPIPFSKEMALVMMADSVEAASRSLRDITHDSINDLVDNIVYYQMINEQYNNSNITYKDIGIIKGVFKRKLLNIYHVRVEYPDEV